MRERRILILSYQSSSFLREQFTRVAEMLDCKTPFEVTEFWAFRQRWGAYDWDSPSFQTAILNLYKKICVYGSATKEDRELLEKLRPLFAKGKVERT